MRTAPRAEGVLLKPTLRDERRLWRDSCGHLHLRDHPLRSPQKRLFCEAGRQDEGHGAAPRRGSARGPTHSHAANDRPSAVRGHWPPRVPPDPSYRESRHLRQQARHTHTRTLAFEEQT